MRARKPGRKSAVFRRTTARIEAPAPGSRCRRAAIRTGSLDPRFAFRVQHAPDFRSIRRHRSGCLLRCAGEYSDPLMH